MTDDRKPPEGQSQQPTYILTQAIQYGDGEVAERAREGNRGVPVGIYQLLEARPAESGAQNQRG
ncbi:MAG: hypothetical protein IH794_12520 [Acidobacteria bacterium]|nr:hypothetical protein [Acidobacteriota bacterium]